MTLSDLFANHMVLQADRPVHIWGKGDSGEVVTVTIHDQTAQATTTPDGKWSVTLPAQKAGGPCEVDVVGKNKIQLTDVLIGQVWVASGQSNMSMPLYPKVPYSYGVSDYQAEIAAADHPTLRLFTTFHEASNVPKDEIHGIWQVCTPENAPNFSAVSYYFGRFLNQKLNQPVGMIISAVGSTSIISWLDHDHVALAPEAEKSLASAAKNQMAAAAKMNRYLTVDLPAYYQKAREGIDKPAFAANLPEPYKGYMFQPSGCYNAMIAPLVNLPIAGFIWYQGEGDNRHANEYTKAFEALIQSWRTSWQEPDAPFLFVQISAHDFFEVYRPRGKEAPAPDVRATWLQQDRAKPVPAQFQDNWAKQRLAQAGALELPRTGMAVSCDFGAEPTTPHYPEKKPVGERLARIALNRVYGVEIPYHGPLAGQVVAQGNHLVIPFDSGDGPIQFKRDPGVAGFEIAGRDQVYHPATATIDGNTVIVSSPDVPAPALVRYGFAEYPTLSLYNSDDLPAPPFVREVGNDHAELDAINTPALRSQP